MTANRAANATSSNQPRYRCPVCGQYPTLTKEGALRNHSYPWYHSQSGSPCPGGGTQVTPLEGQISLTDLSDQPEESHQ